MIKIQKTTRKQIRKFEEREWRNFQSESYGSSARWNGKKFLFSATDDGEVVGEIAGNHGAGVIFIDELIVKESERGRGLGQQLLATAEEFGRKIGAHKMWLVTDKDSKAIDFYGKLGFKQTGLFKNHFFHKDFVIYEKSLE